MSRKGVEPYEFLHMRRPYYGSRAIGDVSGYHFGRPTQDATESTSRLGSIFCW